MKPQRRSIVHGLLALAILLISCDISTLATPSISTPAPGAVGTIVAQTAQAAAMQTAALVSPTVTPTWTPVPTRTASVTPSPSPTFVFLLSTHTRTPRTPTFAPNGDYSCELTAQTPEDGSIISKNQSFQISWTVRNTGSSQWDVNNTDFVYVSGTKMTSLRTADLPRSVAPGDSIVLKITMEAPNSSDTYKTVWTLEAGRESFCRLSLTIVVK